MVSVLDPVSHQSPKREGQIGHVVSVQRSCCAGRGPSVVRIAQQPQLRPTTTRLAATGPQTDVVSDAAPRAPDASKPKGPIRPKVRGPRWP